MVHRMKRFLTVFIAFCILLPLVGCAAEKYGESDFLGKTSAQIEAEFGLFDCCGMPASADGLYRNTSCGYTIREAKADFLGTETEILFFISFDENGIAHACHEGYRPGG